jgi:hypothetical protein
MSEGPPAMQPDRHASWTVRSLTHTLKKKKGITNKANAFWGHKVGLINTRIFGIFMMLETRLFVYRRNVQSEIRLSNANQSLSSIIK